MSTAATYATYATEDAAAAALDSTLADLGLFTVYREVTGTLTQPRPGQRDKFMRIDRVLVPNQNLLAQGWTQGIVGIEVKPSGVKLGPPVAQAMDYSRTVWTLPGSQFQVHLSWVFLWPFDKQHETVASILAQNRIGTAGSDDWTRLGLYSGEVNILRVSWDGTVRVGLGNNGNKAGRR